MFRILSIAFVIIEWASIISSVIITSPTMNGILFPNYFLQFAHLDANLTEMHLAENFTQTARNSFYKFPRLQHLQLAHNKLRRLEIDSPNLLTLDVSYNRIQELTVADFRGLPLLRRFNAAGNLLTRIDWVILSVPLEVIDISSNAPLRSLSIESDSLTALNLGNSTLESIVLRTPRLRLIHFRHAYYIGGGLAALCRQHSTLMINYSRVRDLIGAQYNCTLESAKLAKLNSTEEVMANKTVDYAPHRQTPYRDVRLVEFDGALVSRTLIVNDTLTASFFVDIEKMPFTRVRLVQMCLSKVDRNAFGQLPHITSLWLSQNRLKGLELDVPTLQFLDVSHNRIRNLDAFSFAGLANLRDLRLNDNDFVFIDLNFMHMHSLEHLEFAGNVYLRYVKIASKSLRYLNLGRNILTEVQWNASCLDVLDLRYTVFFGGLVELCHLDGNVKLWYIDFEDDRFASFECFAIIHK